MNLKATKLNRAQSSAALKFLIALDKLAALDDKEIQTGLLHISRETSGSFILQEYQSASANLDHITDDMTDEEMRIAAYGPIVFEVTGITLLHLLKNFISGHLLTSPMPMITIGEAIEAVQAVEAS